MPIIDLSHLRPLDHNLSMQVAANENSLFIDLLRKLDTREWDLSTDCDLWAVRDIVAHMIGWGEAITSPREGLHQFLAARRRRGEFATSTDAQNQVQVDNRGHLTPNELLTCFERVSEKFLRARNRLGVIGRAIPINNSLLGGWSNLGLVADTIFTRDTFMHRIDISGASGRGLVMGVHQELLVADIVRDWARRTGLAVRAELEGPGGGVFHQENPRVTVRTTAVDFIRFLAGRIDEEKLEVEGAPHEVADAMAAKPPF